MPTAAQSFPGDRPSSAVCRRLVFLETYGCQMNVADSELIGGVLARAGFDRTEDPAVADVLLLNTCAIRENAEERVVGRLGELLRHKVGRPHVRMGLLGCMATHHRGGLLERAPYLDLIVGPDGYRDLARLLDDGDGAEGPGGGGGGDPLVDVRLDRDETYADLVPEYAAGPRAYVTVMRGCDKFCTFCVVPLTRGRERSLPLDAIVRQVAAAVALGKREVCFLGQTVNAYRHGNDDFAALLRATAQIDGLYRIRFTSPHPADVTDSMIAAMASEPKVMPYLHLPVQSGSDPVLAAMERGYNVARYRDLVRRVRAAIPGIALSTDVIVGYPGESAADHALTRELLEEVRYDFAYLFKYSRREGTRAAKLDETVSEDEKGRRLIELIDLQERIALEKMRGRIGEEVEVLVDGPARRPAGSVAGRSRDFKTTVFHAPGLEPGRLARVRVTGATGHTFTGELVAAPA